MLENLLTLLMLVLLQAVLGFDNLLYISLESQRVPKERQAFARNVGIGLAMVLRIILLFVVVSVIKYLQDPVLVFAEGGWISGAFNIHSLIVLLGGGFIIYTAVKEIMHMMSLEDAHSEEKKPKSVQSAIAMIVIMNLVFSFDSILSALALTDVFWVMATAIVIGGLLMILLAGKVSEFLQKNRMYEVLGLFILFVVGIMLLSEGGHLAHLKFFGMEVTAMSKTTFYFVVVVLVVVDVVQSRYQRKLQRKKAAREFIQQEEKV
ncbi:MAG: TerC family protein [Bacteroidota bacterium]